MYKFQIRADPAELAKSVFKTPQQEDEEDDARIRSNNQFAFLRKYPSLNLAAAAAAQQQQRAALSA